MEGRGIDGPTLIPEADTYGVAILLTLGLSSFALASEIYYRWLAVRTVRVLDVYCGVLAFSFLWGLLLIGPGAVIGSPGIAWAIGVPVGLFVGTVAGHFDRAVIRRINRRTARPRRRLSPGLARPQIQVHRPPAGGILAGGTASRRTPGAHRAHRRFRPSDVSREFATTTVLMVAVLEELVYRGVLLQTLLLLTSGALTALALVALVGAFALAHVWFGWAHVLAKLPLGALTTASVLVLGTVVPAISAHLLFNVRARRDLLDRGEVSTA